MNLTQFIKDFIKRKGISVGFASAIEKIGGLLLVLIATHLIPKEEFGLITYANTALLFLIPFVGFGIHQGLIRYGALTGSQIVKKQLFFITLKKGILFSIILTIAIVVLAPLITYNLKESQLYLLILSVQLVSLFIFEMIRIYARLINLNKLFAQMGIVKVILMVSLAFFLTLGYSGIGYAISLAFTPLIVSLYYLFKLKLFPVKINDVPQFNFKEYLNYGLFTSLAGVLSQFLYAIDLLLIGNLLHEEAVAEYRVAFVLPLSILFLPIVFIQTDFVKIASKSETDKSFIKNYYLNYLKIFSIISVLTVLVFFFFSYYIMLLFGKEYNDESNLMFIFSLGIMGALLFRVPLGNILSAVGWPKINALNSLIVLIFNVIFSYIFIKKDGIIGAAYVTSAMLWFSGILSLLAFIFYLKSEVKKTDDS